MKLLLLIIILSCGFVCCKSKNNNIKVQASLSDKEILLTSFSDQKIIYVFVPVDVRIQNDSDCEIKSVDFFIHEKNSQYKYLPFFQTPVSKLDFDYHNLKLNGKPGEQNLETVYLTYKITDSALLKSEFRQEYEKIKRNTTEKNKYFNDTIKFHNIETFLQVHPEFALAKYNLTEEDLHVEILKDCKDDDNFREKYTFRFPK